MDLDWLAANLPELNLKMLYNEFRAVIRSDELWVSSLKDRIKQYVQHVIGINLRPDGHAQNFSCVLIDNGQHFAAATIC